MRFVPSPIPPPCTTGEDIDIVRLMLVGTNFDTAQHSLIGFDLPPWRPLYCYICMIDKADQMDTLSKKLR